MKGNAKYLLLLLAAALLLSPLALQAQGEITLESLAEKVTSLATRIHALERALTPDTYVNPDGRCRLAMSSRLHPTSVVAYLEKFPESSAPSYTLISAVHIVPDTGIAITFEHSADAPGSKHQVTEYWKGCQFLHSSEWQTISRW
ncbi:MAG: hypothetical protein OXF76_10245 [Caldilineaceae bacterium]|nr:hypothetical protein [Caldilineaceae bacterium]